MLTRGDISKLLLSGLRTEFMKGYKGVSPLYNQITTEIMSNKASENYGWLGDTPQLKEWIDERTPKALKENGFVLINKKYEASIAVDNDAFDDDQYGQIKIRVNSLGTNSMKGYDREFVKVLEAGHTKVCYDGQNFFDTDHEEGTSGVQSNYFSSGKALSADVIKAIVSQMRQYKSDTGEYVGVNPTHILVPTGLEFLAKELFDPTYVNVTTDPSKATLKGLLQVIVSPYLTNSATVANSPFYILDLSGAVKPFIFQNRLPMQFTAMDKPTDQDSFMRDVSYYGSKARFAFGYGDWRFAFKSQG